MILDFPEWKLNFRRSRPCSYGLLGHSYWISQDVPPGSHVRYGWSSSAPTHPGAHVPSHPHSAPVATHALEHIPAPIHTIAPECRSHLRTLSNISSYHSRRSPRYRLRSSTSNVKPPTCYCCPPSLTCSSPNSSPSRLLVLTVHFPCASYTLLSA